MSSRTLPAVAALLLLASAAHAHFRDVRLDTDIDPARFTKAALSSR